MAKAKKHQLGRLKVSDQLQMERDEIIVELIDRMQKYVVQAEQSAQDASISREDRLEYVKYISARFSGLAEFLNVTLRVDVRNPETGMLYTQEMYNRIHYRETMLSLDIAQKEKAPAPAATGTSAKETITA